MNMPTHHPARLLPRLLLLTLAVAPTLAVAQTYEIPRAAIVSGGGISSGGDFVLSGVPGRHDAGTLASGAFILQGGSWSLAVAVQDGDAPRLTIIRLQSHIVISWPDESGTFRLRQNGNLSLPNNWAPVPQPLERINGTMTILLPADFSLRFFRLEKE